MTEQINRNLSNRGGIAVRDYTLDGSGLRKGFRINFDRVARSLILVSLGLGLAEVIMPKRIQKLVGVRRGNYSWLIRAAGIREITHALLILMQPRPKTGIWSRVVGDAMDLGLLGAAFTSPRAKKNNLAIATASIAGVTAIDALTATQINRDRPAEQRYSTLVQSDLDGKTQDGSFHTVKSITINSSPEELYTFWHDFTNLPQFMWHLQEVRMLDQRFSHWVTKAPGGTQVEWDAEITEDRPNELIAWRSTSNAQVPNSGVVRFKPRPNNRGTEVHVEIEYRAPAGALGRAVAWMFGEEPGQQVKGDLARFKQIMETGEVIRSDATLEGLGEKKQRPARPVPDKQTADRFPEPAR